MKEPEDAREAAERDGCAAAAPGDGERCNPGGRVADRSRIRCVLGWCVLSAPVLASVLCAPLLLLRLDLLFFIGDTPAYKTHTQVHIV